MTPHERIARLRALLKRVEKLNGEVEVFLDGVPAGAPATLTDEIVEVRLALDEGHRHLSHIDALPDG